MVNMFTRGDLDLKTGSGYLGKPRAGHRVLLGTKTWAPGTLENLNLSTRLPLSSPPNGQIEKEEHCP